MATYRYWKYGGTRAGLMRRFWSWIAAMAALSVCGSWAVRRIAFAMLPDAPQHAYGGFNVGLSLPIPLVQLAPHWYAIIAYWCILAAIGACGWCAVRELAVPSEGNGALWPVFAGYALVAGVMTFFSITLSIDGYFYTLFARLYGVYGIDPYQLVAPIRANDLVLAQEFRLLNNPPFPDPYGPGFTLLAGLVGRLEAGMNLWTMLWTWRVIGVGACLLILGALAHMLKNTAPPARARRVAIVAFHPLMLYEGGAGGHNDFLMVAAALWSYALVDDLPLVSGLLLGVAISMKYFAAIVVPFVALRAARKSPIAAGLVVVLATVVPALCFQPFAFGHTGQATLVKVGSSLSMSLNWLLALPLLPSNASDAIVRSVQLAIVAAFALVVVSAVIGFARAPRNALVFRSIAALLWSLPAMHPWYSAWLMPAAAARSSWSIYAWWFGTLSLLIYAHEAVLPTPANHMIFILIAIVFLTVPIVLARASTQTSIQPSGNLR